MSDFKAKMHPIRFPLGLRPRTRWGSLQRSPRPLAVFKGATSKGRERKEGEEGKGRARGMGGEGGAPITRWHRAHRRVNRALIETV